MANSNINKIISLLQSSIFWSIVSIIVAIIIGYVSYQPNPEPLQIEISSCDTEKYPYNAPLADKDTSITFVNIFPLHHTAKNTIFRYNYLLPLRFKNPNDVHLSRTLIMFNVPEYEIHGSKLPRISGGEEPDYCVYKVDDLYAHTNLGLSTIFEAYCSFTQINDTCDWKLIVSQEHQNERVIRVRSINVFTTDFSEKSKLAVTNKFIVYYKPEIVEDGKIVLYSPGEIIDREDIHCLVQDANTFPHPVQ